MAPEAHAALIVPGSAYSMGGPNTGQPANLAKPGHYPVEAICSVCGQVVRREAPSPGLDWPHTGRMAGEPGTVAP